ncbi:hypothetical protein BDY21DRAFT_342091 [Lineolata rhizophorae]|uniref:Ras-associating domain-containing protein n=1 Tax=Lineolata rhizophorae TaxID=578093 RepID=A0A6A6P4C4_9PEZI|nr:hypothetical protein BDY21DRAFT_342091 [Lineolata rhizophorae]
MHCTIDDPCHAVLAKAVRKYGIPFDWRDYTLVISTTSCVRTDAHGGTYCRGEDRAILPDEKPLRLFKELDKQGLKPMFLLRRKEFVGEDAKRAE